MIKIATALAQGVSHEMADIPCQDAVKKYIEGDQYAVVLCDGAGSVEHSEVASNFVCEFLSKYLCENFDSLCSLDECEISQIVYETLNEQAEAENISLDCTLLAIAGNGEDDDIILHIGDGVIIGENEIYELEIVSEPENGDELYYTYFLSGENAIEHLHVIRADYYSYILTSDGISNLLCSGDEVKSASNIMVEWLKQNEESIVENKLSSEFERIFKQYTQDDISVAIINKGRD